MICSDLYHFVLLITLNIELSTYISRLANGDFVGDSGVEMFLVDKNT